MTNLSDAPIERAPMRRAAMAAAVRWARGPETQVALADKLGVTQSTLSYLEAGRRTVTFEMALRIEQVRGLTPGTLARHAGYVRGSA